MTAKEAYDKRIASMPGAQPAPEILKCMTSNAAPGSPDGPILVGWGGPNSCMSTPGPQTPGPPGLPGVGKLGWQTARFWPAGVCEQRGTLAPGLAADIVAMPGNPMEDIESLRKINFVMKDGKIMRRPREGRFQGSSKTFHLPPGLRVLPTSLVV
jgi:hypothetical protein